MIDQRSYHIFKQHLLKSSVISRQHTVQNGYWAWHFLGFYATVTTHLTDRGEIWRSKTHTNSAW